MHANVCAELEVFTSVCTAISSRLSQSALSLVSQQDYGSLLKLKIRADDYVCPESFAKDYLVVSLLSKWKGLPTGIDTRGQALSSWSAAEVQCSLTNKRFREQRLRPSYSRVEGIISDARRKIARVLGPLKVSHALSMCRWSGGATYDTRRGYTVSQKQSTKQFAVTLGALPYFRAIVESDPHWIAALTGFFPCGPVSLLPNNFQIVRGNRFLTVPKSAKTDRCIAAEPLANSFLQQGVGRYIRNRLKRFHVDLDDQSINQSLAARAAFEGLATLDLSMASDTLSHELVRALLPDDWFDFLSALRSPESRVDGKWVFLSKFSSMGNAFTFELESLIFWAICKAQVEEVVQDGIVSVYGDDIIVDRTAYDLVKESLAWCGFTLNDDKSFKDGNFFESCGKHYFKGVDVTPVYQKESVDSLPEAIRLANRLVRWSQRVFGVWRCEIISKAHRLVMERSVNFKPKLDFRPMIPLGDESDDGFLVPPSWLGEWDINHGYKCRVYAPVANFRKGIDVAMLAYKLRSPYTTNSHPKGWCFHGVEGRYSAQIRYIHARSRD